MSVLACEERNELNELDEVCEFFDNEPLVATLPISMLWQCAPELLPARPAAAPQPQAPSHQVECCICLTAQDIKNFATYVPCGHCAVCADCYMKQWHLAVAEDDLIFCPKCRALVTGTLKVFV